MRRRIVSFLCLLALVFTSISPVISVSAEQRDENSVLISESNIPLKLWYDEPSPITNTENSATSTSQSGSDVAWEQYSLPIGNGYFGANIFGRTETERIQLSDKTLASWYGRYGGSNDVDRTGGLNNFSETYIDFGHTKVENYKRYLDLKSAIAGVEYTYDGVKYTREHFTSYPDRALVIKLDADTEGKLEFILRPTVPFKQSYMNVAGDRGGKTGTVTSSVDENGVGYIELTGNLESFGGDFCGMYRVYTEGGSVSATVAKNEYTDKDGTVYTDDNGAIAVSGATTAYIVVTLGTDYELSEDIFTSDINSKPTMGTDLEYTRGKIGAYMTKLEEIISASDSLADAYALLKSRHIEDYDELFGRVTLDLGCDRADLDKTTDTLLREYQAKDHSTYLELLMFQYGRYLLIASSREGSLPANLQGTWNTYQSPEWRSGYWHNINVQMNYWPAFTSNLAETFIPYADFNEAFRKQAKLNADKVVEKYHSDKAGLDGGNGWVIGTGNDAYNISSDRSAGNLGFTTQLYWDWYEFTGDEAVLKEVYKVLSDAARFITKCVEIDEDGHYLVSYCDSPEVHVNGDWYYTVGTTYAQTFAYLNNYNALRAAKALGIDLSNEELLSTDEYSILKTVMEQVDKYDPIHVGLSGQIKEFREEDYYGSIGDDPNHRHVSQLVGLYPGNIINATTPAWIDAAKVTLEGRGQNKTGGWVYAHKMALYARTKDGENAGANLSTLLEEETFPNLFTRLWEVFQIDASFGATAGIGEMLLQSHEGYIEPLAAIPSDWSFGSYTGLVARGNFEVSAAWEGGVLKTANILSNNGGKVSFRYPAAAGANLYDSKGRAVSYSVLENDLITFDTEAGETYIISAFAAEEKLNAPSAITLTREGFGDFTLSWTEIEGAAWYNVYAAAGNAPTYTLIASTEGTSCVYSPDYYNENERTTFAVTAVSGSGCESERTLCYYNPIDTSAKVVGVSANVAKSGELQIIVDSCANSAAYRLYEKNEENSEYKLIYESAFPLLVAKEYSKSAKYAVSALSYYDKSESELYEITEIMESSLDYDPTNILLGKEVIKGNGTSEYGTSYTIDNLTDGSFDKNGGGRYSSKENGKVNAVIDLDGLYSIDKVRLCLYKTSLDHVGQDLKIEAFSNGKWVTVGAYNTVTAGSSDIEDNGVIVSDGNGRSWLEFNSGGAVASKIRLSSSSIANGYVTYYEMDASGILIGSSDGENVLLGKDIVGAAESYDSNFTYSKLNDGTYDSNTGRYSSKQHGSFDGSVDLEGLYVLNEIRFCLYNRTTAQIGTDFKIEIYQGDKVVSVIGPFSNETLANTENGYLVSKASGNSGLWLVFDLGGVVGSSIRFSAECLNSGFITFFECECDGYKVAQLSENLFEGRVFEEKYSSLNSTYAYSKLTDGVINTDNDKDGRFSNRQNEKAGAVIDLERNYALSELKFYLFKRHTTEMGKNWKVEVYSSGRWITVIDEADVSDCVVNNGDGRADLVLTFDLGCIIGSRIRFEADPNDGSSGWITFYESECSGFSYLPNKFEGKEMNALSGVSATVSGTVTSGSAGSLTDGDEGTSLSVGSQSWSAELDLGEDKRLYTLKISELIGSANLVDGALTTASDKTSIEVYSGGKWIKIISDRALSSTGEATLFDLYGIIASKLRITFKNTNKFDGESEYRGAVISEISCTETSISLIDRGALIEAIEKLPIKSDSDKALYFTNANYLKFKSYAIDKTLNTERMSDYIGEIEAYISDISSDDISSYQPKMSITLDSCLIMNVYVPKNLTESFKLDGKEYTDMPELSENEVTLGDGKTYYLMKIELDSYLAARDVMLIATVDRGDSKARGVFSFSILDYAKSIDASGSGAEKQLAGDMLSYIRAAVLYFTPENTGAVKEITAVIGEGYDIDNPVNEDGSLGGSYEGLSAATFRLTAAPSFVFYLPEGADASRYTFKVGEGEVDFKVETDKDGAYIEISLYAYQMCETVTYFIDGTEKGSYHISSYLAFARSEGDKALITLTERFIKYSRSALEYRTSLQ
ncbi:MAG: glycoside hydrolase N-terminal domain-containing protein [Clostridia bacterium]|nr:glycoside hydrolase N-terminal domain-containing protein [Clostridia bacterium]